MLSKLLSNIKKIFILNDKESPKILLIDNENDYKLYANFLVKNFKYVTQGFKILYPNGQQIDFNVIVKNNKYEAMTLLWQKFLVKKSSVYILIANDKNPIGFAIMEPDHILSYLFIDKEYRQQGFGSSILTFLKEKYNSFTVRIESNKYKSKLPKFYEKNNFKFVKKIKNYNEFYYEYKI